MCLPQPAITGNLDYLAIAANKPNESYCHSINTDMGKDTSMAVCVSDLVHPQWRAVSKSCQEPRTQDQVLLFRWCAALLIKN